MNIVLLGDFNSEPSLYCEDILSFTSGLSAEEVVFSSSVPVSADVTKIDSFVFYDPFSDPTVPLDGEGTYFYNGTPYDYDRILMNAVLCGNYPSFSIEILDDINSNGFPSSYSAENETGFSEHFPVKLTLY